MSIGNISVIRIYERPKQGIASQPLNHDFLNKHSQAESEGLKPIDKTVRHKQSQSSWEVMTQTWQQRIICIWYKKDASLGVEGVNKIYYSKPFVFCRSWLKWWVDMATHITKHSLQVADGEVEY